MSTEVSRNEPRAGPVNEGMPVAARTDDSKPLTAHLGSDEVWQEIAKASFAVVGYATPAGEPRSSGVVYKSVGRRLYVVVAPDGWKAKHIASSGKVSIVVPVRRGGILSLLFPIPPATISFHATAKVHPAGSMEIGSLSKELASLLPADRRNTGCLIELVPEGEFLTYGIGVSLTDMRHPDLAGARLPVI
jgi:hypothetical protein